MLSKKELNTVLKKIKKNNLNAEIIVAVSTQSIINKIVSHILGHGDAYTGLKLKPKDEELVFLKSCKLIKKFNFLFLYKVYLFNFR